MVRQSFKNRHRGKRNAISKALIYAALADRYDRRQVDVAILHLRNIDGCPIVGGDAGMWWATKLEDLIAYRANVAGSRRLRGARSDGTSKGDLFGSEAGARC
jgi:hypothetical protein